MERDANDVVVCAICGVKADDDSWITVRESWIQAGGFGSIPDEALVHVVCDQREQARLTRSAQSSGHAPEAT